MSLSTGVQAPDFTLPSVDGSTFSLSDFLGKKVILYFYPKDSTPGCTTQACDFRDSKPIFDNKNTVIIGISKDSLKRHENFRTKNNLNFILLSDENSDVCEKYGVWQEKKNYGKTYMGIVRTTFVINEEGVITKIYDKVKVKDHINTLLADL